MNVNTQNYSRCNISKIFIDCFTINWSNEKKFLEKLNIKLCIEYFSVILIEIIFHRFRYLFVHKSDQVKWNLQKIEGLVYDAKIREKIYYRIKKVTLHFGLFCSICHKLVNHHLEFEFLKSFMKFIFVIDWNSLKWKIKRKRNKLRKFQFYRTINNHNLHNIFNILFK